MIVANRVETQLVGKGEMYRTSAEPRGRDGRSFGSNPDIRRRPHPGTEREGLVGEKRSNATHMPPYSSATEHPKLFVIRQAHLSEKPLSVLW